jgi:hypothetical protein
MKFISHRGNTSGPNKELENNPEYILETLKKYDVEIDVWFVNKKFYLGHDEPTYYVDLEFLKISGLWCHAKTPATLEKLIIHDINCFSHNIDDVVLTSSGYLWTYPGKHITKKSIAVMPEMVTDWEYSTAYAYCSDYFGFKYN